MDVSNFINYVLCVIVCVGLDLIGAQPVYVDSYGGRGYLGRRAGIYPRYPSSGLYGPSLIRRPIGRPVPIVRVPAIVEPIVRRPTIRDNSERTNSNIHIENNNHNINDQRGAGRVTVNQVSGRQSSSCPRPCSMCHGPYQQCVYDPHCPGGLACQEAGFMIK